MGGSRCVIIERKVRDAKMQENKRQICNYSERVHVEMVGRYDIQQMRE